MRDGINENIDLSKTAGSVLLDSKMGSILNRHTNELKVSQQLIKSQVFLHKTRIGWNLTIKEEINTLLLMYQKHLTKKYFFRTYDNVTKSKLFVTDQLLKKLKENTYENFFNHVYGISTTNILSRHRDLYFIQTIGQFFKRHNQTKGALLLDNIFFRLNEKNRENTISV